MSETDADLAVLLDRVERGEEIEITRGDRIVARLVAAEPSDNEAHGSPADDFVARARALRSELAGRGVFFTREELKELRDEGRS